MRAKCLIHCYYEILQETMFQDKPENVCIDRRQGTYVIGWIKHITSETGSFEFVN